MGVTGIFSMPNQNTRYKYVSYEFVGLPALGFNATAMAIRLGFFTAVAIRLGCFLMYFVTIVIIYNTTIKLTF